jgi:two-component system nitrate/nitrite response regulator NarL
MRAVPTILIGANTLLAEGLRRILSNTRFRVAKVAETPDDLRAHCLNNSRELFFIVGGEDDAVRLRHVRRIREQCASARIVVLAERCEVDSVLVVLQAGASAYLLTTIGSEALLKSFDLVLLNESVLPWQFVAHLWQRAEPLESLPSKAEPRPPDESAHIGRALSSREAAILRCLVQGHSNKVIARTLVMTEATVKVHLKAILRKIHVSNRTQAAIWAMNHCLDASNTPPDMAAGNGGGTHPEGRSSPNH